MSTLPRSHARLTCCSRLRSAHRSRAGRCTPRCARSRTLMIEGVGGLEAHVLLALDMGMPAENFGRIHHLPGAQLAAVIDGMRDRGLIGDDGWLSNPGRAVKQRVEELTDNLAAKPYESLEPDELAEL